MPDTKNARFGSGGLPNVYMAMGETAENVADRERVTREEMDAYAATSQQRAVAAQERGFFAAEITPVTLPDGRVVDRDDGPRPGTTVEKLAALAPAFRPDGRVTAGNACPLNDGAAAVVLLSADCARALGIPPLARVVASAVSAVDPEFMGLGPIEATRRVLARARLTMRDVDLVEMNEAFAAQVVPCARALEIPEEKLNVCGGAIALGHPVGMTGARLVVTLLNALAERKGRLGLATLCVGGGQGMALVVERL
jgi:acetyl-CoA C-acetyltransferase